VTESIFFFLLSLGLSIYFWFLVFNPTARQKMHESSYWFRRYWFRRSGEVNARSRMDWRWLF